MRYALAHLLFAVLFFVLALVFVNINTFVVARIAAVDSAFKVSKTIKQANLFFIWVFFLIYLPIGLSIVCSTDRLSVAKCLELGYGSEYCEDEMLDEDEPSDTLLWDYNECPGINNMRSISQCLTVVSLLVYMGTIGFDLRNATRSRSIAAR